MKSLPNSTSFAIAAGNGLPDDVLDLTKALDEHAIVAVTDVQGRILGVNDKFCAISQYDREELLGQDHRIINSGHHSKGFIRELWTTIASGRVWKGEICNRARDGSLYWVATTIVPYLGPDGKPCRYIAIRADISERKRTEESLRISLKEQAEMKAALDEHAIVAITDPRGRITYVNDKFCAISKYSREELLGQDHRIINSGHHSKEFIRELWTTIGNGKVWKGEICNRARDGSYYWVDTTIVPFLGEDGKPKQYIAIRADISARKAAEEKLRSNEEGLRSMISSVKDYAIILLDPAGNVLDWNLGAQTIKGYLPDEIIGQNFSRFYLPEEIAIGKVTRELEQAAATGRSEDEGWRLRKDGSRFWANVVITALRNASGELRGFVKVTCDLTQRKQAEDKLRNSFKEISDLQAALDQHSIVAITDPRGRITYVNDKFCDISKYSREELIGQDHRIINSGYHNEEFIRELWTTIASAQVWKGEICNRAKDGSLYWVDTTIVPFLGESGKPTQYIAIRTDITERKRDEQRRAALLDELRAINTELNQFAYVVSHDLKAPLRAISSLANWLSSDYGDKLGDMGKTQLDLLLGRVKRMDSLVEGILRYSRIGREQEEITEVDLNELVAEVCELVAPPPTIRVRVEGHLPCVPCERTRLIQVFENLIANAVKYMGKPEGEVVIHHEDIPGGWKFAVRDTGPGIDEKYFAKIFQIFQTLRPRDEQESTGIGLAVVKKNVEVSGGQVWVESKLGEGSTFWFRLPRQRPPSPAPRIP